MIGTAAPFMTALAFLLAGNPAAASSAPTGTSETTATTAPDNALENDDGGQDDAFLEAGRLESRRLPLAQRHQLSERD